MKDVIFENPRNKKLSKPIDNFKRLPKDTLDKLSNIENKEMNYNEKEERTTVVKTNRK
ncbi:MAG: hypothetical protein ACI3T9_07740 [Romboutsia timonensis]